MMNINIKIPEVSDCDVTRCAYNVNKSCHARAITIGDNTNPLCDTFFDSQSHAHNTKMMAGVGACKVSSCKHNDDLECQADHIRVGTQHGLVKCMTFET